MAVETEAPDVADVGEPPARSGRRHLQPSVVAILLPVALVLIAGGLRFYRVGYPDRIYFDETYYATHAEEILDVGVEKGFAVHPPVGKWFIATSKAIVQNPVVNPIAKLGPIRTVLGSSKGLGNRGASAFAGTVIVLMTYLMGLRLFRRRGVAALAAFLVAIDGLAFTMSRIAMLDIFLAMFVAIGVWLLLVDRDNQWAGLADLPEPVEGQPVVLPRRSSWARWLAGVAFGLAFATKVSAVLAIAGAGLFMVASEMLWRRRVTGSPWTRFWTIPLQGALIFLVIPIGIYVLSYLPWFANYESTRLGVEECAGEECQIPLTGIASRWFGEQIDIAQFHLNLEVEHPYRSPAYSWLVLARPVAYYYESCTDDKLAEGTCVVAQGHVEEILGIGNPIIWWLALPAYVVAIAYGIRRRDWRAAVVVGFMFVQYVPWLVTTRPNFLFYLTPAVPFMCLSLAYAVRRIAEVRTLTWVPAAVVTLAMIGFAFWYPIYAGAELSTGAWKLRMLFGSWI